MSKKTIVSECYCSLCHAWTITVVRFEGENHGLRVCGPRCKVTSDSRVLPPGHPRYEDTREELRRLAKGGPHARGAVRYLDGLDPCPELRQVEVTFRRDGPVRKRRWIATVDRIDVRGKYGQSRKDLFYDVSKALTERDHLARAHTEVRL